MSPFVFRGLIILIFIELGRKIRDRVRHGISIFLPPFLLIFQEVIQGIACPGIFLYLCIGPRTVFANFIYSCAAPVKIVSGMTHKKFRRDVNDISLFKPAAAALS